MHVDEWLQTIPSVWVYVLVGAIIGLESLGIPLPGEIVLVSAALLSSRGSSTRWSSGCARVAGPSWATRSAT